jgi:ABC-type amino acid transport substrate-binding protein
MKLTWNAFKLILLLGVMTNLVLTAMVSPARSTGAQGQKPLIAVIPKDFPPTYFKDPVTGQPAGLAVDLTNELARRAGFTVEYRYGEPWEGIEQDLLTGKADLIPLRVINDKSLSRFIFTHKLDATPVNYIVRTTSQTATGPAIGKKVGVIRGSTADVYLKGRQGVKAVPYDSLQHLFMDLITGRIDLALTVPKNLLELAGEVGMEDHVRVIEPPAFEVTRGIALLPKNAALRDRFNRAIESLEGTPERKAIYQRWLGNPQSWWTVRRLAWIAGAFLAFLIAAFLVLRFVMMRRLNRQLASERSFLHTSKRPYKEALPVEQAFALITAESGSHFDPEVTQAFVDIKDEILAIKAKYADNEASCW